MSEKKLSFQHLLSSSQITKDDISQICNLAKRYSSEDRSGNITYHDVSKGKVLASLFFEPSTRTRFSFEAAILKLGGQVITLEQGNASSATKGETLSDMGRIVSGYADLVVMRHPTVGSVKEFATYSDSAVINAGDGANQHPTQSLLDIYTILDEKNRLDNMTIGILGDLKHGRTVFSLMTLLSYYPNNRFVLISHSALKLQQDKVDSIKKSGCKIVETDDLKSVIGELDILYVTRVQEERFESKNEYIKTKDTYRITKETLESVKSDFTIMHPLPRVNEIDPEVDFLPYAKYFEQAKNGLFVRMSLLSLI